jgi:hypothetical protein
VALVRPARTLRLARLLTVAGAAQVGLADRRMRRLGFLFPV